MTLIKVKVIFTKVKSSKIHLLKHCSHFQLFLWSGYSPHLGHMGRFILLDHGKFILGAILMEVMVVAMATSCKQISRISPGGTVAAYFVE